MSVSIADNGTQIVGTTKKVRHEFGRRVLRFLRLLHTTSYKGIIELVMIDPLECTIFGWILYDYGIMHGLFTNGIYIDMDISDKLTDRLDMGDRWTWEWLWLGNVMTSVWWYKCVQSVQGREWLGSVIPVNLSWQICDKWLLTQSPVFHRSNGQWLSICKWDRESNHYFQNSTKLTDENITSDYHSFSNILLEIVDTKCSAST